MGTMEVRRAVVIFNLMLHEYIPKISHRFRVISRTFSRIWMGHLSQVVHKRNYYTLLLLMDDSYQDDILNNSKTFHKIQLLCLSTFFDYDILAKFEKVLQHLSVFMVLLLMLVRHTYMQVLLRPF